MKNILKTLTISLLFVCSIGQNCLSYDNNNTHPYINSRAAKESKVDGILRDSIGFSNGIESKVNRISILDWIAVGGKMEDEPESRCLRHFHDPLKDWDHAGLLSSLIPLYRSSIRWAQTPESGNSYSVSNEYSWQFAKEYYYQALLTGSEEYWAKTFRALGQVMHLVSDAASIAHVRNDPHPFVRPYETWVENNYSKIETIEYKWFSVSDTIFDKAVFNSSAPSPISALWDHDEYLPDGSNMPDGSNRTIGLSEYTNANFWTEDTFDDYPHPSLDDTNYDEGVWRTLEPVDAEDAITDHRMYFSKTTGEIVPHFMAAGYWFQQLYEWNKWEVIHSAFILDERCFEDYAEKLIPRAIGYSAALLDYFFRGSMEVRQINLQGDGQWISGLEFEVTNSTLMADGSTVEAFENGSLSLAYRYTLPGVSEPQFGLAADIYAVDGLSDPINADFVPVSVAFPDDSYIPPDATNVSFTLVFRGRLGNEDDAVVGQVFTEPSRIAYSYRPDGWPDPSHIYTVLSDGSDPEKISSDEWNLEYFFSPDWGPHGMSLAFESEYDPCPGIGGCYWEPRRIIVVDMASRTIMSTLSINDESHAYPIHTLIHPSFSPDGSQIAAAAIGLGPDGSQFYAVVVFDVQTGAWHYINGYEFWDRGIVWDNLSSVSWSPLGDRIAYALYENNDSEAMNIHTISPNGTNEVQLTFGDYKNGDPSWSRDGEQMVFVSDRDGGENLDVWSMDKNGQIMRRIINCAINCGSPSFSPDGSKIVFSSGMMVYTADSAGSNVQILEDYAEHPAWSY